MTSIFSMMAMFIVVAIAPMALCHIFRVEKKNEDR